MNLERLQTLIDIMQRVVEREDNLNLATWQNMSHIDDLAKTEEDLHACGTPACVAGWLAVSPEFKADGGEVGRFGEPIYPAGSRCSGSDSVARWLQCSQHLAKLITAIKDSISGMYFYGGYPELVTAQDVVNRLEQLKKAYA